MCEPFRTAALALSEDEVLPLDPSQQWSPIDWDNRHGTVTLAGDAAHSMLPRESVLFLSLLKGVMTHEIGTRPRTRLE